MNHILKSQVQQAVSIINNGGIIAFPTETVYGLGANVFDKKAIQKIFDTKNRPADNPLIVHISSLEMLNQLTAYISLENQKLIDAFWPGPLGIVFPKSEFVPDIVTAGLDTRAILLLNILYLNVMFLLLLHQSIHQENQVQLITIILLIILVIIYLSLKEILVLLD